MGVGNWACLVGEANRPLDWVIEEYWFQSDVLAQTGHLGDCIAQSSPEKEDKNSVPW